MTLLDVAEPSAPAVVRPSRPARVLAACTALFVAYLALSFLNDPRGYLGTDTGGKVATLRAMERSGSLDPDIGYWAERWDPEGRLHPLYYTLHLGDRWVNVTTLPALYAAYPLFKVFGYHGTLVLPMLGSVLAALAARALTRRLRPGDERTGWLAFWLTGLASPLTIYALDFWEHSIGVALVGWAVVLLYDLAEGKAGWRAAAGAGLLVGSAATMRTEALVYGAVATAVACGVLLVRRRHLLLPLVAGLAVVAGLAGPLLANQALERAAMGSNLRAGRSAGAVLGAGQADGSRVEEAALTATALTPTLTSESYLMGGALLALLLVFALRASQGTAGERVARVAGAGVAALYLARAFDGLGFVPGLVAAAPIAAVGLALGWRRAGAGTRLLLGIGLLALPLVWAFQFTGGAGPQWGGRYILPSGLLLTVVGVSRLAQLTKWARTAIVALAVLVTCFGLVWLSARSHDVGRTAEALSRRPEPVLVSRIGHLAREAGWYAGDHQWLTAPRGADVVEAARVAAESGATTFGLVDRADATPPEIPGWTAVGTDRLRFISDVYLGITTYSRT